VGSTSAVGAWGAGVEFNRSPAAQPAIRIVKLTSMLKTLIVSFILCEFSFAISVIFPESELCGNSLYYFKMAHLH